ncbi:flagellar hook-associated family protein [uncultured Bartonella sp.]|uniref:flagellar hook-associated family protein n=1 Tax=uncultured Bartonella sp. TaxID=104108 RepID=UPI0026040AD2|nr:flagellar hook-associated family protein [uncultured Bartonella sp.]
MKINLISSYVLNNSQRPIVAQAQADLIEASYEATNNRIRDPGLKLGRQTGRFIENENQISSLNGLKEGNELAANRMSAAQSAMQSLIGASDKTNPGGTLIQFNKALMGDNVTATPKTMQSAAQSALDSFVSAMNTSYNGEYVFGGTNTQEPPFDYYKAGSNTGASQVVLDAFQSFFGFSVTDPGVNQITDAQMTEFIDGPFSKLFEEPSWSTNFSRAEDGAVVNRISATGETIDISSSANEAGFRHAMKNMVLVAEFGNIGLSDKAQQVVSNRARASSDGKATGSAITEIITVASTLGNSQARVKNAIDHMNAQLTILNQTRNDMIGADYTEASAKMVELQSVLQISYTMTSKIAKLSLVNYL